MSATVVGAGLMGGWHAAAIRRTGGKVTAVVDSDNRRAGALASRYPGARVYTRLEDALSQSRPSVVHLCTPTATHRGLAEQALEAGSHLMVEKPLASTLEDTQDLLRLAEASGLAVCPVHQFVFQDGIQRMLKWLPEVGEILQVSFVIHSAGGVGLAPKEMNLLAADILPHPLSLLQVLLPGSLQTPWVVSQPAPGELRVIGTDCGSNTAGTGLSIEISLNARPTLNSLTIAGERATLIADLFHGFAFRLPGTVSRTHKVIQPFETSLRHLGTAASNLTVRLLRGDTAYPGLRRLVALFYQAIQTGGELPITHSDSLAVAKARQIIIPS